MPFTRPRLMYIHASSHMRHNLGLECGEGKEERQRRRECYLNLYSHIDQPQVEVRLARDNNDPDLGARHVSVLLSFPVIDPAGLLSAAWIHSQASLPQHTAVTRHKEGSISKAARCLLPHPPIKFTPSPARETEGNTSMQKQGQERKIG